jgi:hypothetical protein
MIKAPPLSIVVVAVLAPPTMARADPDGGVARRQSSGIRFGVDLVGTYGLSDSDSAYAEPQSFGLGMGARIRLGYSWEGEVVDVSPRLSTGFLEFPNSTEDVAQDHYSGHDVQQIPVLVGLAVSARTGRVKPYLQADAGVSLFTATSGEEGRVPALAISVGAGADVAVSPTVAIGPLVTYELGGDVLLRNLLPEPGRGALTFGIAASFSPR